MKSVFAFAAFFAGYVAAQSTTSSAAPPISTGDISPTDVECLCGSTDFQQAALACLQSQCPDEVASATALQSQLCGASGSTSASASEPAETESATETDTEATATAPASSSAATSRASTSAAATSRASTSAAGATSRSASAVSSASASAAASNAASVPAAFNLAATGAWAAAALGGAVVAQLVL